MIDSAGVDLQNLGTESHGLKGISRCETVGCENVKTRLTDLVCDQVLVLCWRGDPREMGELLFVTELAERWMMRWFTHQIPYGTKWIRCIQRLSLRPWDRSIFLAFIGLAPFQVLTHQASFAPPAAVRRPKPLLRKSACICQFRGAAHVKRSFR